MNKRTERLLRAAALLLLAAVLVWVNLPEPRQVPAGTGVGERLPDFRIPCVDGGVFTLSQHRGEVVVINLWATWCTPCVKELPHFDRLQRENPGRVAVLALHVPPVTTDVAEYISAFSYEIPFAVDEDGSVSALLNAGTVLPQTVILSPEGIVTYNGAGSLTAEKLAALTAEAGN